MKIKGLLTNTENIARPSTSLILIGILKGYISNPIGFLLKSKLTFRKYKKSIKLNLPLEFIKSTGLIAWIYIRLSKKLGQEKAFEIIRVSVSTSGFAVQQANLRNVEAQRSFNNLKIFQKKANKEGSTKLNTVEIIAETERKYEFRVTKCVFYELFNYLNVPELTSIMCSIDNAIFNTYLPDELIFHRNGLNKTIYHGNKYCEFVIEKNENTENTNAQQ
jgi:hypothetical protein